MQDSEDIVKPVVFCGVGMCFDVTVDVLVGLNGKKKKVLLSQGSVFRAAILWSQANR